jgi:hypothetical protein
MNATRQIAFSLLTLFVGLSATGCSSAGVGTDEEDPEVVGTKVCVLQKSGKTADKEPVTICDQAYDDLPLVRPPADTIVKHGVSTLFVGIKSLPSGGVLVDRNGTSYDLADASGKYVSMLNDTSNELVKSLHMPSNRNMFLLYKVTGTVGTTHDTFSNQTVPAILATSIKPVILLSGRAIDSAQLGAWEGSVSGRLANPPSAFQLFDPNVRIPIRVSFTALETPALPNLPSWDTTATTLPDGTASNVAGVVENMRASVKGADGKCIPSLAAMGASDPFDTKSSADVTLYRVAAMHTGGDNEHVLAFPVSTGTLPAKGWTATGMGSFGRLLPSDFIALTTTGGTVNPHGLPTGANMELHPVKGGGGGC